jgi:cold-inducible RNA-binding protein
MRIFVGNLSYQTTEDNLTALFSQVGQVESASIVTDRGTGRSRGFAFVEMDNDAGAKAIEQFNGYELDGRTINVNEARPRNEGGGGGGGGRGGYGGGRGGSGGGGGGRGGYGGNRGGGGGGRGGSGGGGGGRGGRDNREPRW